VLAAAAWQLIDRPFKILVVGPATAADRARVDGLEERFVFAGPVRDMDLIYPACDALVHPTYYDACSLVVLEALASGLPVITTTANGASMYLDDSNGRVIAPGDATALKVAMAAMMRGPRKSFNAQTFKDQAAVFTELEAILEEQFQQLQR
jgi:UDP-glucose:(heptosyl)LPS alpha-1,3-glucosyltransferase